MLMLVLLLYPKTHQRAGGKCQRLRWRAIESRCRSRKGQRKADARAEQIQAGTKAELQGIPSRTNRSDERARHNDAVTKG